MWRKVLSMGLALSCILSIAMPIGVNAAGSLDTIESVQVNQVGYIRNLEKNFVVARTENDNTPVKFQLINTKTGKEVFAGNMKKEAKPYEGTENEWKNYYYTGDFTEYQTDGQYQIKVICNDEVEVSPAFSIGGAEIYDTSLNAILSYFRGERDIGRPITYGGKEYDNRIVANQFNNNQNIDLHGAWYDASNRPSVYMGYVDNYNYMVCPVEGNTSYLLFTAYEANKEYYDRIDYNHNGVADILEEAVWGCDWYVRLKPQNLTEGYFYAGVETGKVYNNESVKEPASIRIGAGTAIAALAKAARYKIDSDFTAEEYGKNAKQAWEWYSQNNASQACEDGMEHMMDDIYWGVAAIEMYKTFKEQKYLDKAIESIDKILARQSSDDNFSGWFDLGGEDYNKTSEGGPFHNWLDEASVLYPLIDYAKMCPDDANRVNKIKDSVKQYMDFKLEVSKNSGANPYGYAKQYYRQDIADEDSTLTRFFQYETGRPTSAGKETKGWVSGENGRLLSLLYASVLADEFLDTDKYTTYGLDQLNWVYGVNPFYAVMQSGIGDGRNLAEEIGHGGSVPYGGFINGIRGDYKHKVTYETGYTDSKDIPYIDNSYWTGEWFLPIGSEGILAFSKLLGVHGKDSQIQPKGTIIEAEDNEYLLTAKMGSDMSQDNFAVNVSQFENASSKAAVTGIDDVYEGVLFGKAPEASHISLRYAALKSGSMGLYINGKRQDLYLPETGSDTIFATVNIPANIKKGDIVSIQFDEGDTAMSLDYIIFNDIVIKDIEKLEVATLAGEKPILPSQVNVVYSDDTTGIDGVKWNEIDKGLYSKPGTLEVTGKLMSNGDKVTAVVHVYSQNDVVRIKPTYIAFAKGLSPHLPKTVEVYFDNGLKVENEVVWEKVDSSIYSKVGQYEIEGTLKGISKKAFAQVTVFDNFPEGTSDLAFGKKVTASGENSTNYITNINDGDISTRWESAVNKGNQWIEVDLEKEYSIGSMDIFWETACAKSYSISISSDHTDWTTIYKTTDGKGGTENLKFDNVTSGRYVRIDFTEYGYANWKAYSIYKIHLFQAPYAQNYTPTTNLSILSEKDILTRNGESMPLKAQFTPKNVSIDSVIWKVTDQDGNPTDCAVIDYTGVLKAKKDGMVKVSATTVDGSEQRTEKSFMIVGQSSGNLALNKSATSNGCYKGSANSYAVDGDASTRWTGLWNTNFHWYQVDLGESKEINSLTINWENAYSKKYKILVSDAVGADSWTEVYSTTAGAGGIETIEFAPVTARHVKLESSEAAMSQYGISIWEFGVYNIPHVKINASDVADLVKQISNPSVGMIQLNLPTYDGFDVNITSSSNEKVVKKDGTIIPPSKETNVDLTITVQDQSHPDDKQICHVTIKVPATVDDGRDSLEKLCQKAEALDSKEYLAVTYKDVMNALAGARLVLNDSTAQISEVKKMKSQLSKAIDELMPKVDRSTLQEIIDKATNLDKTKYTKETYAKLLEVLKTAKDVLAQERVTQDQIDEACTKLETAIDELKLVPDNPDINVDPTPDEGDKKPNQPDKDADSHLDKGDKKPTPTGDNQMIGLLGLTCLVSLGVCTLFIKKCKEDE